MTIRKKFRACVENVTLGRVMITIGILVLLSTVFGCQSAPIKVKMYSGPELERSKVAIIRGEPFKLAPRGTTRITYIDGNPTGIKTDVLTWLAFRDVVTRMYDVIVLPGIHQVGFRRLQYIMDGHMEFESSFLLEVEAGKTYQVKLDVIPEKELPDEQKEKKRKGSIIFRLWVEDLEKNDTIFEKYLEF